MTAPSRAAVIAAPARVAEVTTETELDDGGELLPLHLAPEPPAVSIQLRTTLHRVGVGVGLARKPEVLEAVRAIPGLPGLVTSPSGGTFIMGGPGWLGISAVGAHHPGQALPLDWMMASLLPWFTAVLGPLGLMPRVGCIDGAWCKGFSDIAVGGRKLVGLGFRVTRGLVVMRGVMPVAAIDPDDFRVLAACHDVIGVTIRADAATSVAAETGDATWTTARMIDHAAAIVTPGG